MRTGQYNGEGKSKGKSTGLKTGHYTCRPKPRRYKSADVRTGQCNGGGKSKSKGKSTGLKTGVTPVPG